MVKIDSEIGQPGAVALNPDVWLRRNAASEYVVDPLETNIDLKFPNNIPVYDEMRTTDGQIGSMLSAVCLPIMSAKWQLEGSDVDPAVMDHVRRSIGMPKPGEAQTRRRRQGVNFKEHLQDALLVLPFGFMPFEQVYEVADASDDVALRFGMTKVLHLRKLAPRLPRTISQIHVGRDGGLAGISQTPLMTTGWDDQIFMPVERIVMYVLQREGADWSGRSILRQAYKHWLINDRLVRLSAQIVERNGMGVPVITYNPETWTADEANTVGSNFRAGATASLAVPVGNTVELKGVTGATYDPLPLMKYHDEKIAASALAMFLTLGHDAGARSLGDTFVDVFTKSLQSIADAIATTFTEHVIRDLVELNFGPDEPYPALVPGQLAENKSITSTAMKELVDAGIVTPDDTLEAFVRKNEGLPEIDEKTRKTPTPAPAPVVAAPVAVEAPEAPAAQLSAPSSHNDELAAMLARIVELRTGQAAD